MASDPPIQTGADDVHAHPRHTGSRWVDLALALSAVFISAVSLGVAIDHGRTERQLVAANSWPFLRNMLDNGYDAGKSVVMGMSNGGVGPAKVQSLEVFYDGRAASSNLDVLRKCCGLPPGASAGSKWLPKGFSYSIADNQVLRPGEENPVMQVWRKSSPEMASRFADALLKLSFRVCYCSVFDECFIGNLKDTRQQRVKACPKPEHPYSPNGP